MAEELGGLARPVVSVEDAARVARERWGVEGEVVELGSNQDRNFRIGAGHVLKVANAATDVAELEAQNASMGVLAEAGLRAPRPVESTSGRTVEPVEIGGVALYARLLTYVEGTPLMDVPSFGKAEARMLGETAGRIVAALAGFEHAGTTRTTQWDVRAAPDVVRALLHHVPESLRARVANASLDSVARVAAVSPALPLQVIHGDVTDDNLVIDEQGSVGVIDLGDLMVSWRVAELTVAITGVLANGRDDPLTSLETVRAFAEQVPLEHAEVVALWPLVVLRCAVLVTSAAELTAIDEGNDYAAERTSREWRAFRLATSFDPDEMAVLVAATVAGVRPRPFSLGRMLPEHVRPSVVDLSVLSPSLDAGRWLEPDAEQAVLDAEGAPVSTRWAEHRLTQARPLAPRGSARTLALGVDVVVPDGTLLHVPFEGERVRFDGGFELRGDALTLVVRGDVEDGDGLGLASGRLRVQLHRTEAPRAPFFVSPRAESLWRALSPDPSALLGVDVTAPQPDPHGVLARRDAAYAPVQEHYYAAPPQVERGWRELMIDTQAQVYVDAVNNVATTGHAHPHLVEAATRQWSLLNTNSRFHYAAVAELSERLAALAPDGLDSVFLVNSGSEAVDLAIRLAQVATGRPRMLAAREAYHGWTLASDAVSTSLGDNPRALESRPDWVELIDAPNSVRGTHRGPDAAAGYLADLDVQLNALGEQGRARLAGVVIEPIFGNGGGVLLPDGYLTGVFERVRALGGVCISDEVQVSYGRLGEHFWGFEQQDAVPDVITVAKAMGNGQPLGAVITTREIADAFAAEGSFFSSAGGSPVSSRIGLAVLDVLESEGLQENAREVGGHFRERLLALAERHPAIGAVHGMGLYLGVELVSDRETFAPATQLAADVCDLLLEEGAIVQPTGDHKNVLKIKPPLVISRESVDFVVGALDRVLSMLG